MTDKERIEQLQTEAERLYRQLEQYYKELVVLRQQISQLKNTNPELSTIITSTPKNSEPHQNRTIENFIGLRLIHLVGMVILVIGLSIGVKYAIDKDLISEGMRIALAYAAGITLYGLSLWLKKKYKSFSAILISGAMASLYFTTYAAFVYYQIFSFFIAFIFMILLTFYTVYEALRYNRQEIALLGLVGAYAIPFLISQNNDRADLFFLYITLINIGIIFLSIKKDWKSVGWVTQAITWLLFIGWAATRFDFQMQWVGFLFMIVFFLLFLVNELSVKIFYRKRLHPGDAYAIVLNNVALYIASLFVIGYSFTNTNIALITFCLSALIATQAITIHFLWKEENLVTRMLAALAVFLFIVFIAVNWDGVIVTLLWLLTAVSIFSIGVYRKSVPVRMTSILLMGLTLLKLVLLDSISFSAVQKIIAYVVLGVLLLVVSFFYQKFRKQLFG